MASSVCLARISSGPLVKSIGGSSTVTSDEDENGEPNSTRRRFGCRASACDDLRRVVMRGLDDEDEGRGGDPAEDRRREEDVVRSTIDARRRLMIGVGKL